MVGLLEVVELVLDVELELLDEDELELLLELLEELLDDDELELLEDELELLDEDELDDELELLLAHRACQIRHRGLQR